MIKAIGVIPARWGSTRFPGKPLALIEGKALLQHVIEGSRSSKRLQEIWVATDDNRIADLARSCGAKAVMTDSDLATGTDRVWQAVQSAAPDVEVIVNIQGDEPLIEGRVLDQLVEAFEESREVEMATLARTFSDLEGFQSINTAKIVLNNRHEAVYFSRFPIPFSRATDPDFSSVLKHIGIYAYRRGFLGRFCAEPPTALEKAEGLEQLRALYLGARIKVIPVDLESWGVDTPEDVQKIETIIRKRRAGL